MILFFSKGGKRRMDERIKQIRNINNLSQQKFADKLGIARGNIAAYEVGKNAPSDAVIALICKEFNVNEVWLRTGNGEMFIPVTRNQEIVEFAKRIMSDEDESFRKRFVTALSEARPEFWDELEVFLSTIKKD